MLKGSAYGIFNPSKEVSQVLREIKNQRRWGSNTRKDSPESGQDVILNAAIECYQKKGVTNTTIHDIATQAKISRRTVYRYFPNKQHIIQAVVDEQAQEFFCMMDKTISDFSVNFLERLKNCMLYAIENGPKTPGHKLMLGGNNAAISSRHYFSSKSINSNWEALLRPSFEQAIKSGEFHKDVKFNDLMAWSARIIYSYIQFPDTQENIERQVDFFLLRNLRD